MHDARRQPQPRATFADAGAAWAGAAAAMVLALLAPALWNGFPLIFSDTGGYLARPFAHTLSIGRSAFYGAFLAAGLPLDFWPVIVVQAALCTWLLVLTLRVLGLGGRPALALGLTLGLTALTSLPWFASQLMPDVLLPLAVLALFMLAFRPCALGRGERIGLGLMLAAAIASHMAILGLMLLLLASFAAGRLVRRRSGLRPALGGPALAMLAGLALALLSNLALTGELAFTPGGETFLFGRLIQDGIIGRYLAEHCPDASPRLCPYRDALSPVADDWLWSNDSPLFKVGGWREFAPQERRMILATLRLYPGLHLATALKATLDQLRTTETIVPTSPDDDADAIRSIAALAPRAEPAFRAARQQRQDLDIGWINLVHMPAIVLSVAGLFVVAGSGIMRGGDRAAAALALTLLLALLFNAAICGIFSNASDRYESRLVCLAPFAVAVAWLRSRRPAPGS